MSAAPAAGSAAAAAEVADLRRWGARADGGPADILLEVPHGATSRADFEAARSRLVGALPPDLAAFFHVNTDEGAPELAVDAARRLAASGHSVLVLRCRIPRTLVDANRVVDVAVTAGMTAGLPPYVRAAGDRRLLLDFHARYQALAERAYAEVCGAGGLAIAVHTYAPRTVEVEVGDDVVTALRRAYRPGRYASWELRPEIDLITAGIDGGRLAPSALTAILRACFESRGLEVAENRSYRLHPATSGFVHASRWPGRVLCVEFRRDLLGVPWRPFVESRIGPRKVARLARALAEGVELALG